jgi:hypothetical protein
MDAPLSVKPAQRVAGRTGRKNAASGRAGRGVDQIKASVS